jgi:hypothetical protein
MCWSLELQDGSLVFAKVAGDHDAVEGNLNEAQVLANVRSPHLPALVSVTDDGRVLVVEDLSDSDWTPDTREELDGLWGAVAEIGSYVGPASLWQSFQGSGRDTWSDVLSDERFAPAIGIDPRWLDRYGSSLAELSAQADTRGDRLVHGDLAPGNWCHSIQGGWRFVDWASAHRGNPVANDVIASIRLTRLRDTPTCSLRTRHDPALVAFMAGRFASELLDRDWSDAPPDARTQRIADIRAAIVLSADLTEMASPDRI